MFWSENLKGGGQLLEDLGVDGSITVNYTLRKYGVGGSTELICLMTETSGVLLWKRK
jgi:hypothetical protein